MLKQNSGLVVSGRNRESIDNYEHTFQYEISQVPKGLTQQALEDLSIFSAAAGFEKSTDVTYFPNTISQPYPAHPVHYIQAHTQ